MQSDRSAGRPLVGSDRGATENSNRTASIASLAVDNKAALPLADLAEKINAETSAAETHARSAMQHALTAGRLLVQAKRLIPHGEWQQWVEAHCTIAIRTASAYMRLVTKIETLPEPERQRVADLPVRDAIRAISTRPETPPHPKLYRPRNVGHADRVAREIQGLARTAKRAGLDLERGRGLKVDRVARLRARLRDAIELLDALVEVSQ